MTADPHDPLAAIEPRRTVDAQNPWPGLDAFNESSAQFFNGRDAEAAELTRLTTQSELTVLFGKSGVGKTSLLQAGLFPLLRRRDVLPVPVRLAVRNRDAALVEQLTAALLREVRIHDVQMFPPSFEGTLWERLHRRDFALWSPSNRLLTPLFVLDQFEEVFTLGTANAQAVGRLRIDLANLIENRIPAGVVSDLESSSAASETFDVRRQRYRFLLSFREDFLPDIETWRREIPSVMRNRLRLREMNAEQAFAAVHDSASKANPPLVDEKTAREIVRFVGKIPAAELTAERTRDDAFEHYVIEPALLSLMCTELNKRRYTTAPPRPTIDADLLRGSADSIISEFYLRQVAGVSPTTRAFIEDDLLTEGGYRTSFPLDEALQRGALTEESLRRLVDGRLLRIEQQLGVSRVELTHDRLTDVVRKERDRRLEKERSAGRRRAMKLYGGAAILALLLLWFETINWSARRASEAERDEANRLRGIAERALAQAKTERARAEQERARAEQQLAIAEQARKQILVERGKTNELATQRDLTIIDGLQPEAAEAARRLLATMRERGIDVRLTAGYRSPDQQAALYARGRTTPGSVVTNAKVSVHNTGLAFDVAIFKDGKFVPPGPEYATVGEVGQKLGLVWSGSRRTFQDPTHFETRSAQEELRRLNAGS